MYLNKGKQNFQFDYYNAEMNWELIYYHGANVWSFSF